MKRSARFLTIVMFSAFVAGSFVNSPSAEAGGGNCQAKLAGSAYTCNFNDTLMGPTSACIEFFTGGVSSAFDFVFDPGGGEYGCVCQTTGSVKSPSFDSSGSAFECAADFGNYQLSGKINGKKVSGQGSSDLGESFIFSCTKLSTPCP